MVGYLHFIVGYTFKGALWNFVVVLEAGPRFKLVEIAQSPFKDELYMKTETTPLSLNEARARKWLVEFKKGELAWPPALNNCMFALFPAGFGQGSIYHLAPQVAVLSSC